MNSAKAMPSVMGSKTTAEDMPRKATPAFAKPNTGTTRKATQDETLFQPMEGDVMSSGVPLPRRTGMVMASVTPEIVA